MKTSLFIPCTVDTLMPEIGIATHKLLSSFGAKTIYHKEQTCCGQPLFNSGYHDQARLVARHFIEVFGDDEHIVSPAGSCVCMVKYHYPELFKNEPLWLHRANEIAGRIFELSQFVVDVLGITDVGASFNGAVTYHESCHILRGLNVSAQPKALITGVKGAKFIQLNDSNSCCGFGGEFAAAYPEISGAIVTSKVNNFIKSDADVLLVSEPGCLLNIQGYLYRNHPEKKAMHLASFLADNRKEA